MTVGSGTGTTVSISGTGTFSGKVTGISVDGVEIPVIDVSHMGTSTYREKVFGSLAEPGSVTIEVMFEPDNPPVIGETGTMTITWLAGSPNPTLAGTGAITAYTADTPLEDAMTGSFTWSFDGQTGPTWA